MVATRQIHGSSIEFVLVPVLVLVLRTQAGTLTAARNELGDRVGRSIAI
jgi:hypothetical protein